MWKHAVAILTVAAAFTSLAQAQDYPTKPITLVVPYGAGSTTDTLARTLGQALSERVGQPVVVDNRPGAGGNIGTQSAAVAAPDGYTLLMGTNGPMAANPSVYANLPFDPVEDFAPIMHVVSVPLLLVGSPAAPAATVQEMVDLARSKPGEINFGATNTTARVWIAALQSMAGIEVETVIYKDPSSMLTDLMSGRIQFAVENVAPTMPLITSGKINGLAVLNPSRAPFAPDLAALSEAGYTDYDITGWIGFFAPEGTPDGIIRRLNEELQGALEQPEVKSIVDSLGVSGGGSPERFEEMQQRDLKVWADLVKSSGIEVQ